MRPGIAESVEQLVSLLTEELFERGHDVTLFATGDSATSARLVSLWPEGYESDERLWDWRVTESLHVGAAYARAHEFDVVHCHSDHYGLPFAPFIGTPNVHTHHVEMSPTVVDAYNRFTDVSLVVASHIQARDFTRRPNVTLIHHGIDTSSFPLGAGDGGYLLFLGRLIPDKGPAEAIEVARAANMPLILAGPLDEEFDDYFRDRVAPLVDGHLVRYVGRVEAAERNRLLADAVALVYPLRYPEPFGLVMTEAMACGTPVLACDVGAVREIVEPGATGFIARSVDELTTLVPAARRLDRPSIRRRAVERFDFARMVDEHEELYLRLAYAQRAVA